MLWFLKARSLLTNANAECSIDWPQKEIKTEKSLRYSSYSVTEGDGDMYCIDN